MAEDSMDNESSQEHSFLEFLGMNESANIGPEQDNNNNVDDWFISSIAELVTNKKKIVENTDELALVLDEARHEQEIEILTTMTAI